MATDATRSLASRDHDGFSAIFRVFLGLGLTSFGGPTAHIGYFRRAFVDQRGWLNEGAFAQYFAFANVLPGPTSSQLGLIIGLHRGGMAGAAAAFLGFTLPSFLLMLVAGLAGYALTDGAGWLQGLMAAAVGVVAHAVWTMSRGLCPDLQRRLIAVAGFIATAAFAGNLGQLATLVIGASAGLLVLKLPGADTSFAGASVPKLVSQVSATGVVLCLLIILVGPFLGLPDAAALFVGMLHSGSFIFGGGHVVLPLLQAQLVEPGLMDTGPFLAGYALAQAVPGPMFTIAAYLGAAAPAGGALMSLLALMAIFLPSFLLVFAVMPYWSVLQQRQSVRHALTGLGAAVVGLLAATLVFTVVPEAVTSPGALVISLLAIGALFSGRVPAYVLVAAAAGLGWMFGVFGWMQTFSIVA